jgi:hypothetical protein
MQIIFESYNNSFSPIKLYDFDNFKTITGRYPILEVRKEEMTNQTYQLNGFSNIFKLANKENKELDKKFGDGVTHYNATYKPQSFDVYIRDVAMESMPQLYPLHNTRGLIKCTIITDWGTTNIMSVRALEFNEYNNQLTYDNPSTSVATSQNTEYLFSGTRQTVELFAAPMLFAAPTLYSHVTQVFEETTTNSVMSISNKTKWTFKFDTNSTTLRLDKLFINGENWTIAPYVIKDNDILVLDFGKDEITKNGTKIGTTSANCPEINTYNLVRFDINDSSTTPLDNIYCDINLKVSGDTVGQQIL